MSLHFVNNYSHTIEKVVFNGANVRKVIYNDGNTNHIVFLDFIRIDTTTYDIQGEYNGCDLRICNLNPFPIYVSFVIGNSEAYLVDNGYDIPANDEVVETFYNTTSIRELDVEYTCSITEDGLYYEFDTFSETITVDTGETTTTAETVPPEATTPLSLTKAVSSEGNFTLYQGGENK